MQSVSADEAIFLSVAHFKDLNALAKRFQKHLEGVRVPDLTLIFAPWVATEFIRAYPPFSTSFARNNHLLFQKEVFQDGIPR